MQPILSIAQRSIVDHDAGAILVLAGPGAGKTRVLTERVRTLLEKPGAHFKVLALTFSNKAANEMSKRLDNLDEQKSRAVVSTIHGFCLELLSDRGKLIGVPNQPQIFEKIQDRLQILRLAVNGDPWLANELINAGDAKQQSRRINDWLNEISRIKAHPLSGTPAAGSFEEHLVAAYNSELAASGAFDFDDLLLYGHRLLTEVPQVADLYRRIYAYICVDEAQDLNEAQYALLVALCGSDFRNVMLVGDPKQSIYGFNTSSPEFMDKFAIDFGALRVDLNENFRSSKSVVEVAQRLLPSYKVEGQLPIVGAVKMIVGDDEEHEASLVANEIQQLQLHGHPDIEGGFDLSKCAVLGRNRFCISAVELELKNRDINFYRRLSAVHEYETELVSQFVLSLRLIANPTDTFHLNSLLKLWGTQSISNNQHFTVTDIVETLYKQAQETGDPSKVRIIEALKFLAPADAQTKLLPAVSVLKKYADELNDDKRRSIYNDTKILVGEWDQYLRNTPSRPSLAGFLSNMALGSTQLLNSDGVALMTVHASKGLEFDVVFLVGLVEGVFPDYRSTNQEKSLDEEKRNAFVAVTRSKRLLYLTYSNLQKMPWGDLRRTVPSRFLTEMLGHS